jgi:hypothetical protein
VLPRIAWRFPRRLVIAFWTPATTAGAMGGGGVIDNQRASLSWLGCVSWCPNLGGILNFRVPLLTEADAFFPAWVTGSCWPFGSFLTLARLISSSRTFSNLYPHFWLSSLLSVWLFWP